MQHRALQHALEAGRRARVFAIAAIDDEIIQFVVEIGFEAGAQALQIDLARRHHAGGVLVVDQREQQMLQRHVFVTVIVGEGQRPTQSGFQRARKRSHERAYSFSIVHCSGCSFRRAMSNTWATLVSATSYVNTPQTPTPC
jgi:hypothetical protein